MEGLQNNNEQVIKDAKELSQLFIELLEPGVLKDDDS